MAALLNIARPYAVAAFETAREQQQLPAWKAFLASAAMIAEDRAVKQLLANPEVSAEKLVGLFVDILTPLIDVSTAVRPEEARSAVSKGTPHKNFLLLLTEHNRLSLLPGIAELFNTYYTAYEKINNVRVVTAVDMQKEQKQTLIQALTKRIHGEVTLNCEIDPSILGGAIIYINNSVIDGSVRGQLTRLRLRLSS